MILDFRFQIRKGIQNPNSKILNPKSIAYFCAKLQSNLFINK
jgi:hypothetical protein